MKTDATATVGALLRVNRVCDAFEAEYRAGRSPRIEEFVARSHGDTVILLEHLIPIDVAYRRRCGERPTPADYANRFPALDPSTITRFFADSADVPFPSTLGEYDLVRQLGSGGMGVVYLARHRRMNREVALKAVPPSAFDREHLQERFAREVEVTATLSHPNVVAAYDAREDEGVCYLVTAYLEGGDLGRRVRRDGPLSIPYAVRAVRDAALGLGHAHERGVFHRDVKPSNLLINAAGRVCVADWGLAKTGSPSPAARKLTIAGTTLGTVDYLAPELAGHSEKADARSDVYSLGCVLFFLLTGRPPFPHGEVPDRLEAHRSAPVPDVSSLRPEVPAALAELVAWMLTKNPTARPQNMNAVVAALDRAPRRLSRRALLAGGVVALAVPVAIVARKTREEPPSPPPSIDNSPPGVAEMPFADPGAYQRQWARHLGVAPEFADTIGGVEFRFVLVPPGRFRMGTPEAQLARFLARANLDDWSQRLLSAERERAVNIARPFYLGKTEMTVEQFTLFVDRTKHRTHAERDTGWGYLGPDGRWERAAGHNWKTSGRYTPEPNHPVGNVAWNDAAEYCEWLRTTLSATCRLPCESEWEYACRGGRYGVWPHGDDAAELRMFAVYGTELPAAVGCRKPNGFGLLDMCGNAAEMCALQDRWTDDPTLPVLPDGGLHPVRGGRFNELQPRLVHAWPEPYRCARRNWEPPESLLAGFRVLLELPG